MDRLKRKKSIGSIREAAGSPVYLAAVIAYGIFALGLLVQSVTFRGTRLAGLISDLSPYASVAMAVYGLISLLTAAGF